VSTLIIAEAGVNHNGDLNIAKEMIRCAAESGADLVKFQTINAKKMATDAATKSTYQFDAKHADESQREMLGKYEFNELEHLELIDTSKACGIGFFSTAFDIESLEMLIRTGQKIFKIPSGEITNLPLLRFVGDLNMQVILSTGMSSLQEISDAITALEASGLDREKLTILHCTTSYPLQMTDVNLRAITTIASQFELAVGYSDHTLGTEVAIAAVALGATVIEKHFTLSRNMTGPDHKASLEPHELQQMVVAIRNLEIALGDGKKRLMDSEVENLVVARKSLVAKQNIKKGESFSLENLTTKRPGSGISPMLIDSFIGKMAEKDYLIDELIEN
jgi:N,N'-diacetyllegionaminate synthase